jgi:hypothetical protein
MRLVMTVAVVLVALLFVVTTVSHLPLWLAGIVWTVGAWAGLAIRRRASARWFAGAWLVGVLGAGAYLAFLVTVALT